MIDARALFAASPAPMLAVATDAPCFTVVEINDAYLEATSWTRDEVVGRSLFAGVSEGDGAELRASIERVIATRAPDRMPVRTHDIAPPGNVFDQRWWEPVNAPVLGADGEVVAVVHHLVDATERHRAEAETRAQAARGAFRRALDERLRDLIDPVATMKAATELLGTYLHVAQAGFAEVESDDEHILVADDWNDGRIPSVVGRWRMDDFGPSFIGEMKAGETIAITDVAQDPRTRAADVVGAYARINTRAILDVPLVKDGRMVALLFVHDPEARAWTPGEIALAEETCERLWSAVERARAEGERRRAEEMRAAQTRVLESAVRDMPLAEALDGLVRAVESLSRSNVIASILLVDEEGTRLRHGAAPSLPDAYCEAIDGIAVGPAAGSCGTAVHRKRPVYVSDIASDPLWADFRELALSHGLAACWSTPIVSASGAVLGTVAMYHRQPREPAPADLELVEFAVGPAALLIERKGTEARLRASEARTRFALKAGRLGAWELNVATGELLASETCRTNFGRPADEPFTYEQLREAIHPDDRHRMTEAVERSIATGEDYDIEYRILTPEGETRWVQIRARPSYTPAGAPLRMTGMSLDITERRLAEAALRASETRLRFLSELDDALRSSRDAPAAMRSAATLLARRLAASRCAYADVDGDGDRFVIRSDFTAPGVASSVGTYSLDLFGPRAAADMRRGQTLVVHDVASELAPDSGREMFQAIGIGAIVCCPLVKHGRLAAMMAVHQDGPRRWEEDEIGLVEAVVERCWAHVERVGAEARLRDSEARLRAIVGTAPVGIVIADANGAIYDGNARAEEILGHPILHSPDIASYAEWVSFHADGRQVEAREYPLARLFAGELRPKLECHYRRGDGRLAWVRIVGSAVRNDRGEIEGGIVAILDIDPERRAEAALRELNETLERQVAERTVELRRFRDIIEATTSPICAFDTDYRLIAFNRAHNHEFRRVNGFESKLGDVFPDLFIADQRPVMRALMSRALAGECFTVVEAFGRPEYGQPSWEISYTPLRDESGRIIGAFHLATDISDRLRAEADLAMAQDALRQSQKMEAMGSLTGGVAHDFNNLLTPIVGGLDMLQRKAVGGPREQRLIAGAMQSAERAKVLVQRLLAFARRQPLQPVAVDLGALVSGMAELVGSTAGPRIRVSVEIADDLPAAVADPNQLEMALLNLAVNARDAMPDGGTLRIAAAAGAIAAGHASGLAPGRYVRLSVADTGIGMDEATLKRAVEPFFSTKGVGKGTGLGLSMVHGLAQQLRGALTIRSRIGAGTDVELWLPESVAPAEAAKTIVGDARPVAAAGTALLVDDEDVVRMSTAEMLADLGYAVTEASSAEKALALIRGGLAPTLIVTDHLMPGMSGTDLARTVRATDPDVRILLVSGYAEGAGVAPDLPRLTKPFRNDELAASLAGLASARPGDGAQ